MRRIVSLLAVSVLVCLMSAEVAGASWGPNANDLDTAINTGDFSGYFRNISTWLNQKIPANASNVTEASMKQLLKDPVFANTLDQRQLISKHGVDKMGAFARVEQSNMTFLAWLLRNTEAMDLYLESVVPTGISAREKNSYTLPIASLGVCPSNWFNQHSFCFLLALNPDYREGEFPCGESNVLLSQSGTHRCRKPDVCCVSLSRRGVLSPE